MSEIDTRYTIDLNINCIRIYQSEDTKLPVEEMEVISLRLFRDQALQLARVLREATPDWEGIDIVGHRFEHRFERRHTDKASPIIVDGIVTIHEKGGEPHVRYPISYLDEFLLKAGEQSHD